jgi:WD40 repeat protein
LYYEIKTHDSNVTDVSKFEKLIITCSKDMKIKFWNKKTFKCIKILNNVHKNGVVSMNVLNS